MWMALLFLAIIFILSLITTLFSLPTKKLLTWFQSLCSTETNSSSIVSTNSISAPNKVIKSSGNSSSYKSDLRGVFTTFDKNNDGFITKRELKESLEKIGIFATEKDVSDMVEKVDSNGDGLIDLDEFCRVFDTVLGREEEVKDGDGGHEKGGLEEDLREAFDVFDEDKDGLITVEELGLVLSSMGLKEGKRMESCKEMIRKVDLDGDGMVNFDEFRRMMRDGGRQLLSVS